MRVPGLLAAAAAFALMAGAAGAAELRVLNWQGYGTDEAWAVAEFKQKTGADVVHDYFNSEQEMLTKLRTNPGYYDVVLINSSFMPQAASEGLLQGIDKSKLTNFADLQPALRDSAEMSAGGQLVGVSWVWGVTSFAVNDTKVTPLPDSIQALWDPAHAGKVAWRDDAVEAVQMGALATGQPLAAPTDMAAIRAKLLALKPQVRTFWSSEDEWNKLFQAGDFDLATYWSGSAARARKAFGLPATFVIPKEGAIGWFDGLAVVKGAPNADLALAFIDYMVSPGFYVHWETAVGAPASANVKAIQELPETALNRALLSRPDVFARLQFMKPLDDAQRQAYLELWQGVKTELAQ